jgi:hypothetical protein
VLDQSTEESFDQAAVHVEGTRNGKKRGIVERMLSCLIFLYSNLTTFSSYITFHLDRNLAAVSVFGYSRFTPTAQPGVVWERISTILGNWARQVYLDAATGARRYGYVHKC